MLKCRNMQLSPQDVFGSIGRHQDLVGQSVRGGVATLGGQVGLFAINILRTIILARLLTPTDFGVIGMVTVVINFAEMFKTAGLSMATVQKETITRAQISTLFWLNLLISVGIGAVVFASAPLVARFYGLSALTAVMMVLSLSFLLGGFTIQHHALLQRHMRFGVLAALEISAQVSSLVASIVLAWLGFGYWALVGGVLVYTAARAALTFLACPWIPGRWQRGTGVRSMLSFGGHITGFNLINYFARNADNLLIGKFIGAAPLGFYDRAYRLLLFPISMLSGPLGAVAVPALCRLRTDRARMHKYYLHLLYLLSIFTGPIVGIAFLSSDEIVLLLLGREWSPVSEVYRLLAIGGLLQPLYNTQAWLHVAADRSDRVLRWAFVGTPIILASFAIGLFWGVNGVALAYSLAILLATPLSLGYAGNSAGLRIGKMASAVGRPIGACVLAVLAVWPLRTYLMLPSPVLTLGATAASFLCLYSLILVVAYGSAKPLRDMLALLRHMRRPTDRTDALSL